MCGINIVYHNNRIQTVHDRLQRMNNALLHRGPDEQGIFINDGVALGHTRLSIVDLKAGQQPMPSSDGQYHIVYNGELLVYHYLLPKDLVKIFGEDKK